MRDGVPHLSRTFSVAPLTMSCGLPPLATTYVDMLLRSRVNSRVNLVSYKLCSAVLHARVRSCGGECFVSQSVSNLVNRSDAPTQPASPPSDDGAVKVLATVGELHSLIQSVTNQD